jgi:hypothetical protein
VSSESLCVAFFSLLLHQRGPIQHRALRAARFCLPLYVYWAILRICSRVRCGVLQMDAPTVYGARHRGGCRTGEPGVSLAWACVGARAVDRRLCVAAHRSPARHAALQRDAPGVFQTGAYVDVRAGGRQGFVARSRSLERRVVSQRVARPVCAIWLDPGPDRVDAGLRCGRCGVRALRAPFLRGSFYRTCW